METDSTLSALALAISIVVFGLTEIAATVIALTLRVRTGILRPEPVEDDPDLEALRRIPGGATAPLRLLNLAAVAATVLSMAALVVSRSGTDWVLISVVETGTMAGLGLLLAVSRAVAIVWPDALMPAASRTARALSFPLYPILLAQSFLLRGFPWSPQGEDSTEDRGIEMDLEVSPPQEDLDEHEVRMIRAVVQLDTTIAREIMVPRVDVVAAEAGTPVSELAEQMLEGGHSRVPVFTTDLDHVEGVAHARDLLHYLADESLEGLTALDVARPALFIPESKTLEGLLDEFQEKRLHLAIVVDEYGGVSGIVTIEDLLEEIVGEIQDEFDVTEPDIQPTGPNEYMVDARVNIDQLNEVLQVSVESDGFDTVGGFVFDQIGKIANVGDIVQHNGLRIEVMSTLGRRMKMLKVTRTVHPE
ncbi:MAG: hemolysin family protein [SAR202 cluster bacterium]|nr:hemolysin family protein [SAR202 cluster bacterium]